VENDRFGCKKFREELFEKSLYFCKLGGFTKNQVDSILGKPDFYHRLLFKNNLKDTLYQAIYYMDPCEEKCRFFLLRRKIKIITEYTYKVVYRKGLVIYAGAATS
jgi:hypothetical protein